MDQHELNDVQAADETGGREPAGGTAAEELSTAYDPGDPVAQPEVLARFPDLDAIESSQDAEAKPVRSDGRILGQGVSAKLLAGCCVLLVLAAIIPWMLKDSGEPKPGTPPAPDADVAPSWNGETAQTASMQPASPGISYQPDISLNPNIPAGADSTSVPQGTSPGRSPQTALWGGQYQPNATGQGQTPHWQSQPQQPTFNRQAQLPSAANRMPTWDRRDQTPPAEYQPPVSARPGPSQVPPVWGRESLVGRPSATRSTGPDLGGPPARYEGRYEASRPDPGRYPDYRQPQNNASRPQARTNQTMRIGDQTSSAAGGYPGNYRPDYRPNSRLDYRRDYHYQADSRADSRSRYPAWSVQPYRSAEPGVARFEGTIEKPSFRTTYDPARSSVH